jgi:SAM-dependent methyltransferase
MTETRDQPDYFANHEKARKFPWTLYHAPLERDLSQFLTLVSATNHFLTGREGGDVLVVGCGLLHEIDAAPPGLRFTVVDIDPRAVDAVLARNDPRIVAGHVVPPETPLDQVLGTSRRYAGVYAKEVIEHIHAWPLWLAGIRRILMYGGRLWLSTPNYGEPWLPAIESTVLEVIARRNGFSRRHIHPTRFSRSSLERGLLAASFTDVAVGVTPTRLAIIAHAVGTESGS